MPSYTNPKSVETRVREALLHQLSQITVANGYMNDIGDVYDDFPESPESIENFPAVAVLTGYETRERFDNDLLYVDLKATLLAFVEPDGYGSVTEAIESLKQDFHAMFGNSPGLAGADSETTCQLAVFASAEPFGRVLDMPLATGMRGFKFVVDITYQQSFTDPTVV